MEYYKKVLRNYTVFTGRATRSEYWYFTLFNFIISFALGIVGGILGGHELNNLLTSLYSLAVIIPSLAVGFRRLHDTNRSGWWLLLALIPIIGWIILIVFLATDSTPGDNKYGPNPKGVSGSAPVAGPTQM